MRFKIEPVCDREHTAIESDQKELTEGDTVALLQKASMKHRGTDMFPLLKNARPSTVNTEDLYFAPAASFSRRSPSTRMTLHSVIISAPTPS